jgi:hypothetical protein
VKKSIPLVVSGLLSISGTVAGAQVGHQPAKSPYIDLEYKQELTLISGAFHGHRDPANVAPQGGFFSGRTMSFAPAVQRISSPRSFAYRRTVG